jgi:hypothetical protein
MKKFFSIFCLLLTTLVHASDVDYISDKKGCRVANPYPRAGETIVWDGPCQNGYADGEGTLQWFWKGNPDDRYQGTMQQGWAEGTGTLTRSNGSWYQGHWHQSSQDGYGRYELADGSWYEGQWKNGLPNGTGQYRRPDGKLFIGEFVNGEFEPSSSDKTPQTSN